MANPPPQTAVGAERRTTPQPPLPISKAPGGEKSLTREPPALGAPLPRLEPLSASRPEPASLPARDAGGGADEHRDPNWGLAERKPRASRQTIVGLTVIVVLVGMFSVLIYKKLQERKAVLDAKLTEPNSNADENESAGPGKNSGTVIAAGAVVAATQATHADAKSGQDDTADPFDAALPELTPAKSLVTAGNSPRASHRPPESQELADLEPLEDLNNGPHDAKPALKVKLQPKSTEVKPVKLEPQPELDEELPLQKPAKAGSTTRVAPETLGDFEIANDPAPRKIPIDASVPNAASSSSDSDPRLGEYVVAEDSRTRAASKTIVKRAPEKALAASPSLRNSARAITEVSGKSAAPALAAGTDEEGELPISTPVRPPPPTVAPRHSPTPLSDSASEAGHDAAGETYKIAPNDTFWTISRKQYGTARYFQALARHNHERISEPARMKPGTMISTPPREVLEQKYPELIDKTPAQSSAPKTSMTTLPRTSPAAGHGPTPDAASGFFVGPGGEPMYRVGEADTLTDIAQKHLGRASRWAEIFDRNKDSIGNPDALKIGTVIRLPADASRLSFVSGGGDRR